MKKATRAKGMVTLDTAHPIVENIFRQRLTPDAKREPLDVNIADFDDVSYNVKVNKDRDQLVELTMSMKCLNEIAAHTQPYLRQAYGPYLKSQAADKVVLEVDVEKSAGEADKVVELMGNVKNNVLTSPLIAAFKLLKDGKAKQIQPLAINYRKNEQIIIAPGSDRVNVILSFDFEDDTDAALVDIFLQEFPDAKAVATSAPNFLYSDRPFNESKGIKGVNPLKDEIGYLMVQIFDAHVDSEAKQLKLATHILSIRGYLLYHVKAAKAQLHERMRNRVKSLLLMLNRAHPPSTEEVKKKAYRKL